jgi:acyl carrier protein
MSRDDAMRAIYEAIGRINEMRDPDRHLTCSEETKLYGSGGALDSLGLVTLIMDVEEAVNARGGIQVVLADERAMADRRNPFRDVRALADCVMERVEEGQG